MPKDAPTDLGPIETWQLWAISNSKQTPLVEVTSCRAILPFALLREAYRCKLKMDVTVEKLKGTGIRLRAEPIQTEIKE